MEFATLFWVGMGFGALVLIGHFITSVQVDHGPMRYQRWITTFIMWSDRRAAQRAAGMNLVSIPVSQYGMAATGMDAEDRGAPDMDAENPGMPRLSRTITDNEMIVLLAVQHGRDGKHRYSANAIHALVGGDRNTVMATIKELRATPPPAEYMQPDGSKVPPSYPITGQRSA